jgi:hypothetical protein
MNDTNIISISKNIYLYIENFSDLLKKNPQVPLCNRDYINERIDDFYNKIIEYKNNNKSDDTILYLNILHMALLNGKLYICDGQHRFYAYKKYFTNFNRDFKLSYIVKFCTSNDELRNYFKDLNNNFILHEIILKDEEIDILERIKQYMKYKYSKHISKSMSPRFPNINIDQLVKYLINTFPNKNYTYLVEKMEFINENIKNDLCHNNKPFYDLANEKNGFFLGYLFIKSEPENIRKKIPKTVRDTLWKNYFDSSLDGVCYVCNTQVNYHNFHAGHIISVKNGGTNNITNLKVLCVSCNLSMGINNLNEFKAKYF